MLVILQKRSGFKFTLKSRKLRYDGWTEHPAACGFFCVMSEIHHSTTRNKTSKTCEEQEPVAASTSSCEAGARAWMHGVHCNRVCFFCVNFATRNVMFCCLTVVACLSSRQFRRQAQRFGPGVQKVSGKVHRSRNGNDAGGKWRQGEKWWLHFQTFLIGYVAFPEITGVWRFPASSSPWRCIGSSHSWRVMPPHFPESWVTVLHCSKCYLSPPCILYQNVSLRRQSTWALTLHHAEKCWRLTRNEPIFKKVEIAAMTIPPPVVFRWFRAKSWASTKIDFKRLPTKKLLLAIVA